METTKSFPVDEVSEIQIKSDLSQVNIVSGSSEDIVVRWTDTKRRTTQAVQIGKVLSIKDRGAVALYGVIGLIQLKADKELTVELPSNFSGYIQIESKDERIRVVGVEAPCALRAKTTAGGIDILTVDILDNSENLPEHIVRIPSADYYCKAADADAILRHQDIFPAFSEKDKIIIEAELFTPEYDSTFPKYELRCLPIPEGGLSFTELVR